MADALPRRVCELLTARLCHELVGPVGATNNGLELLADTVGGDGADPEELLFAGEAVEMASESGRRAGALLKFYRIALGTVGDDGPSDGAGGSLATLLTDGLWAMRVDWSAPAGDPTDALTRAGASRGCATKLLLNLHATAAMGLMRGGALALSPGSPPAVIATGEGARLPDEVEAALDPALPVDELTPRSVQAYFTAWLAREAGYRVLFDQLEPGSFQLTLPPLD